MIVDERQALRALRRRDEAALAWFITRYAAYVSAVIRSVGGIFLAPEDIEEAASDVFLILWQNAASVRPGKEKAYLSGVARNKARERLRALGQELPLEEDVLALPDADMEGDLNRREQADVLRRALLGMGWPDRELFLRHYYYGQPLSRIAEAMDMNLSTVKTRLRRGRERLKEELMKGGISHEDI